MSSYFRGTGFQDKTSCESELFYSPVVCQQCSNNWYIRCEKGFHPSSNCKRCVRDEPPESSTTSLFYIIIVVIVIMMIIAAIYKIIYENESPTNALEDSFLGNPTSSDAYSTLEKLSGAGNDQTYYI